MKLLYAHDHRFVDIDNSIYSESQFGAAFWDRYLRVFESVCSTGRILPLPPGVRSTDLEIASAPQVSFSLFSNMSSLAAQATRRRRVVRKMRALVEEADVVVARLPSELGLIAASVAQDMGRIWSVEVAGCAWDALWNYGNLKGRLYAPVLFHRMRRAVAAAPYALYVTQHFLQRRYPNRGGLTVGCSNVAIKRPSQDVLKRRQERQAANADRLTLGLIGTLRTKYKGIQTVMATLARHRERLPKVEFRVLGAGPVEPWQDLARHHGIADLVFFDGVLPAGEPVLRWLDAVDVYLQPSLQEGLPRALVEAMSRACPALGSTCAGIPELLDPSCLIKPGDSRHLGQLMLQLASDERWRRRQAQRNWQKAHDYSAEILQGRRDGFFEMVRDAAARARPG